MDSERWKQVDSLLQATLERPSGERDTFLRNACTADEVLEREVRSLLAQAANGDGLLDRPMEALLAECGTIGLKSGARLGRYEIERLIGDFPPYSDEREQFSVALYGTSETLKLDSEGRVILTERLKDHAGITEAATFVGLGHKFQIWEPERFRAHLTEATETVRALRKQLGSRRSAPEAHGARER